MRIPARCVAGQLVWTHEGTTWALWRIGARTYPYLGTREKLDLHGRTRAALMALSGESMLVSVCERVDPAAVVEAMVEGVDLEAHGQWAEVAAAALDSLGDARLYRRHHYLAAVLDHRRTSGALRAALASARAQVGGQFGLPPVPVRQREVLERQAQADQLGEQLLAVLGREHVRPATAGEVVWLYARAPRRGLDEPALDQSWQPGLRRRPGPDDELRFPSLASLAEAVFVEGGDDDDDGRPRHRRYLRVDTEAGSAYQAFLAVSDMPAVFYYPGGAEALARTDALGFPVDWCVRVRPTSNADAVARTKRQARQLQGQFDEYGGEAAGPPPTLAAAVEAIDHERAALAANPAEPELQTTTVLAVWAATLAELEVRAGQLRAAYEVNEYGLPRPTGGQLALYGAMLVGSPLPPVARDYTQYGLAGDLAAQAPWAGTEVGDPRGGLLGVSLDGGAAAPVLCDWGYGPSIDRSGSIGAFGSLGSGKSYTAKRLCWDTLARGGQVVAVDRTPMGEYVRLAEVAPGSAQVVRLSDDDGSEVCLDPMAVFAPADRARYTTGFLTLLTGTAPTDNEGAALAEAVRRAAADPAARLGDVVAALGRLAADNPRAEDVYHRLVNFAHADLAAVAFGGGPPVRLDADYLVFHMPGLSLPDKEVLENPHLARQLLPEQVFSQALLYLVAAVARSVAFADRRRFAGVLLDEAWALTANLQGRQLVLDMIRDGRKHRAGVIVLSQHPADLGDRRLADLLGSRLVFRQSHAAAGLALEFLGMEPTEATVQLLELSVRTGQCLYRDVRDRIGLIEVLPAPFPELAAAFDTNPEAARPAPARRRPPPAGRRAPAAVGASRNGIDRP